VWTALAAVAGAGVLWRLVGPRLGALLGSALKAVQGPEGASPGALRAVVAWPLAQLKLMVDLLLDEGPLLAVLWGVMLLLLLWQAILQTAKGTTAPGDPWVVLRVWEGLSSMGGVLGALLGIGIYFRRIKQPWTPYLNALALGTAPGWTVARVGCFLVHDHPGVRTDFFLAVNFPVREFGGPRHDLGLDDALALLAITVLLYALVQLKPRQGRLMGVLAMTYSVSRFFLDTLRASDLAFVDRRYFGLTPAQYVVVGLFAVGVWLVVRKAPASSIDSVQQSS
jgi:prolipoprotein diacylglyceryltransferase